ncbi:MULTISPECIES: double-strand break repair protein AddB [Paracoccus]|jgi:ATP-dependent helicase/nuclease subunit B|uniref:double-strand break repair protein AddB n=1 Tax=Paracoccus TaxID=265 RepID=UPI00258CDF55|nr:double-strand break repair protein AddB [Paracoccus sp. (in: a-proteobacteria)]
MPDWQNGVFALPCGADFPGAFAEGLIRRMRYRPPQEMARVTVYANSGQSLMALRQALLQRGPLLLPRLRLIADLGGGAATTPLARRLELGRLIDAALRAQPDLAQGQSVPELAASLAGLMAEMQLEGLDAQALDRIDASEHAQHWGRALAFLKIAAGYYLSDPPQDREARQRAAAEALAAAWARGEMLPQGPVVVAGSTGSHGATRDFMRAVARLPMGAVVLPGFDADLPQGVWDGLDQRSEDHPQARYAPLVAEFGAPAEWLADTAPDPARNRLISLALRPAPVTDQWIEEGPRLGPLVPATERLTLIEAEQPGEEAEAVALIIREAVERGQPVTLIAADRMLTRRVQSALDRWGIIPDDSAGQPLPLTAPGLFLRHVADLFGAEMMLDALLVLLKHPVTATGLGSDYRREHNRHTRDLELHLRRNGPAFPDGAALREWADRGDVSSKPWALWLAGLLDRIVPLAQDRAPRPLADRLRDLRALAEDLAAGPGGDAGASELWAKASGGLARSVLDHLAAHAHLGHDLRPGEFCDLLYDELQGQAVRQDVAAHPLVRFRGPREARTEAVGKAAGLVILSGLNEGGWPQALPPDPWLSRPMRLAAGLTLPERRVGLAAHDFQQAVGAGAVVLTRARRDAEAETIPSRWLNRLVNLLGGLPDQQGPQALAEMRRRGRYWLDLAELQARPRIRLAPAPRPSPIPPPPALRELSVTEVRTLIRDPYAVYARRVLGLRALDPLRPEPDAAERGNVLHHIMDRFLRGLPDLPETPQAMKARLLAITDEVLEAEVPWPSARLFWRARIAGIADRLMADEAERLSRGTPTVVEEYGEQGIPGLDFRLIARPDRLDRLHDGQVHVYDYKSGKPPTDKQIAHFDKQLPLEAAMVRHGAFRTLGPAEVEGISYIQLGGEGRTEPREFSAGFAEETWAGFVTLIRRYLGGERGFTARLAMERSDHASDYDHLSRHGEWDTTETPQPQRFGDDG